MANEVHPIVQTYNRYIAAFQTLNPDAVVSYYHLPCLAMHSGAATVMTSAVEVKAYFAHTMDRLRALGYGRSEVHDLRVTEIDDGLALLSMRGARYKADGSLMQPLGVTYTLRRTDDGWKFAVLAAHDPHVLVGPVG